ncbi:MAG: protoporphyrinogen oxidase HemJ [Alphaproteobacteria bacterium]|nr:protoporphyrinogen oxidase HemJ [Alphaproteobacteria bacterium]
MSFLADYPWRQIVTALHVISVIAWMAGMLYLPRLFVYHADTAVGSDKSETFKVMERRLLRGIINPAMIAAWTFGLLLVFTPGVVDWSRAYAWVKAAAVIAMSALHGNLSRWRKDFEADRNKRPARFYRIVNEVPTVLMIVIVFTIFLKY